MRTSIQCDNAIPYLALFIESLERPDHHIPHPDGCNESKNSAKKRDGPDNRENSHLGTS